MSKSKYATQQKCLEVPGFVSSVWRFQKMSNQPHPSYPKCKYWNLYWKENVPQSPKEFDGYVMFMTGEWETPVGFVSRFEETYSSTWYRFDYPFEVSLRLEDAIVCASRLDAQVFSSMIDSRVGQLKKSSTLYPICYRDSLEFVEQETGGKLRALAALNQKQSG